MTYRVFSSLAERTTTFVVRSSALSPATNSALCTKIFVSAGEGRVAAAGGQSAQRDDEPPADSENLMLELVLHAANPQTHHHRQRLQPPSDRLRYLSRHILRGQPHLRHADRQWHHRPVRTGRPHRSVPSRIHHGRLLPPLLGRATTTSHVFRTRIIRCSAGCRYVYILPLSGIGTHRHVDRDRVYSHLRCHKHGRIFRVTRNRCRRVTASKGTRTFWWLHLRYFQHRVIFYGQSISVHVECDGLLRCILDVRCIFAHRYFVPLPVLSRN